jgi:AraC-like DNA-binding protein
MFGLDFSFFTINDFFVSLSDYFDSYRLFSQILFVLFYCYLGYNGLFQSKIFIPELNNEYKVDFKKEENQSNLVVKESQIFSSEDTSAIKNKLRDLMIKEKLYKNAKLTLRDLAIQMEMSNSTLSSFINTQLNTNFQNFINSFRIEEFKEKIKNREQDKYTLLSIATSCGFNSKPTFNRVFKQFEGCTPSEYVKRHKLN